MKFVILIYGNPQSREVWASLPANQRDEGIEAYERLTDDLMASGEFIVGEPLADPSLGRRVPATERLPGTTDGPFAEVKEHLAGFILVDCESFERALEHAARVPEAAFGLVEVRPVMDMSAFSDL